MSISSRLGLIVYDEKSKILYFDKSKIQLKTESQLLEYFLKKLSEYTELNNMGEIDQRRIVKEFGSFIKYSLFYMKEFYPLEDKLFFRHVAALNPKSFSKDSWIYLKNSLPRVNFPQL